VHPKNNRGAVGSLGENAIQEHEHSPATGTGRDLRVTTNRNIPEKGKKLKRWQELFKRVSKDRRDSGEKNRSLTAHRHVFSKPSDNRQQKEKNGGGSVLSMTMTETERI